MYFTITQCFITYSNALSIVHGIHYFPFDHCYPHKIAYLQSCINARLQKNPFTVKNGEISGTVLLTAKGGVNAHEWQYTTDVVNLKDRVAAPSTTTAKTEITNREEATKYAFFHKAITAGTNTDWEGPIFLVIT